MSVSGTRHVTASAESEAGIAAPSSVNVLFTDGIAPEIVSQLARVVGAVRPGGLTGISSEAALQIIEAVEAVKAWSDELSMAATAAMVAEFEVDFADLEPEPSASRPSRTWEHRRFLRSCRSAAAREIQVATGLPITQCQRRVWLSACEPERVLFTRDQMRLGRVTLTRAIELTEGTAHLDAFTAAAIAKRVLRPLTGPDGAPLPGVAPLSQATFRARLHRQLVLHHGRPGEAERTHEAAVEARRITAEPHPDGTGALVITGDGPRISAAQCRVDKIARRLRKDGDERTLDQLRADLATDLLMHGWIPNDPRFAQIGTSPAAQVQLIVSLPTVLGLDHGVGQIPGWGAVSGQAARKLAMRAGSIWKRVVTDPLTGRAIEVSARTYRVPAGMAEQLRARDGTCRGPGCEITAERCDLDHCQEWQPDEAAGPTAESNLTALHRGHHNLKTSGFWDSDQSRDGTLQWTTSTGRTWTTYPHVYDHPDNLPVRTSILEASLGRRLAPEINPDIPTPGHLNILDHVDWWQALAPAPPPPPIHTFASAPANQQRKSEFPVTTDEYPPPPF